MKIDFPIISPEEAADYIQDGDCVACSGFTAAGCVKAIPESLAKKAERLHACGKSFQITLFTGASTGDPLDGSLARAHAIKVRMPYQSNKDLRAEINSGNTHYKDVHLSNFQQFINYHFLGEIDYALIEVADYTEDGKLIPTLSLGAVPTFCKNAKHIILEHNKYHSKAIRGLHDVYSLPNPPYRQPIPLVKVNDHIGDAFVQVDPKKILGVVETNRPDSIANFKEVNSIYERIGQYVAEFFLREMEEGRIPKTFLPIQSGVGNTANAVLKIMGNEPKIPAFNVYTEVAQDSVLGLMEKERILFASTCALTITDPWVKKFYDNLDFYKARLVLRPEEITNHPEIIRRLGLLTLNAALEVDCFGNVNSTHVFGASLMNGIGGSGDFARNGYISIFTLPSVAKNGTISSIVPFCSHIDHTEHDVQIIVTEQGLADLRGKSPEQCAHCIIENCAHPDYKPLLYDYLRRTKNKHISQDLSCAFAMYNTYLETGDMRHCKF